MCMRVVFSRKSCGGIAIDGGIGAPGGAPGAGPAVGFGAVDVPGTIAVLGMGTTLACIGPGSTSAPSVAKSEGSSAGPGQGSHVDASHAYSVTIAPLFLAIV